MALRLVEPTRGVSISRAARLQPTASSHARIGIHVPSNRDPGIRIKMVRIPVHGLTTDEPCRGS